MNEVEKYITKNGHLKNIPSAKEIEINGVSIGVMNAKIIEKLEELTLYTINQQKIIDKQIKEIELLKQNLNLLLELRTKTNKEIELEN